MTGRTNGPARYKIDYERTASNGPIVFFFWSAGENVNTRCRVNYKAVSYHGKGQTLKCCGNTEVWEDARGLSERDKQKNLMVSTPLPDGY